MSRQSVEPARVFSDELPMEAQRLHLRHVLQSPIVEGIVRNARLQLADPSAADLLKALNYYLEFDAFLDWTEGRN